MKISIDTIINKIYEAIDEGNAYRTLSFVQELKKIALTDPEVVKWITEPVNIKAVHDRLVEGLGVPAQAMMLKNRIPHRHKRALMFIEGVENGIRRVL